jgi:hypothetical protein
MAEIETTTDYTYTQVSTPTRMKQFWRWIGFRYYHTDSTAEADLMPGWTKTHIGFRFSLMDRLRLLLTGRFYVDATIHSDVVVNKVVTFASFEIGHPGDGRP